MSSVLRDSEEHLFRILHFRRNFPARETGSGLAGGKPVTLDILEGSLDALERFFFSDKLDGLEDVRADGLASQLVQEV